MLKKLATTMLVITTVVNTAHAQVGSGTTLITNDQGGYLSSYVRRWDEVARNGGVVEIIGPCNSGCAFVVARVPKARICFGPQGSLGFHMSYHRLDDRSMVPDPTGVQWMMEHYPTDIRDWVNARGGVAKMTIFDNWMLSAPELWKMGYRKCS